MDRSIGSEADECKVWKFPVMREPLEKEGLCGDWVEHAHRRGRCDLLTSCSLNDSSTRDARS